MIGDTVSDALDLLGDEISLVLSELGRRIAEAGTSAELDRVESVLRDARAVEAILARVKGLEGEWLSLVPALTSDVSVPAATADADMALDATVPGGDERSPRRNLGRVRRGTKTSEPRFRRPILEVLVELGGRAQIGAVLEALELRMSAQFTDVDLQTLASDPAQLRWRNTAQWARNTLVQDGLMDRPRRRGVWEISDEGRRRLAEGTV